MRIRMLVFSLCLIFLGGGVALAQPLVTDGLSVYYSFDSDTFTDEGFWLDGSGNNLHGLTSSVGDIDALQDDLEDIRPTLDDKVRGDGAVHFATDTLDKDDYIAVCDIAGGYEDACDIAEENDLVPRNGFTVAAWVKVEDVGADHSVWQSRAAGGGFIHTQVQGNGNVRFRLRGDSNGDNIVQFNEPPGDPIEFEEWFHYAGTYQKNEGDDIGTWAFYLNGEEVAGGEANGSVAGDDDLEVLGDWTSGAFVGLVPDFARQFVGHMDEFYLFHRGLSAEEVSALFTMDPLTEVGDFNANGSFDVGDLDVMTEYMMSGSGDGDLDGDGDTDFDDRKQWIDTIQGSYVGDSNFDGEFNSGDMVTVFGGGKYESGEAANYGQGDWNGDGLFNSGDLVSAFGAGGYEIGPRAATAAVPEPNSLVLLSLATLSLAGFRRRR